MLCELNGRADAHDHQDDGCDGLEPSAAAYMKSVLRLGDCLDSDAGHDLNGMPLELIADARGQATVDRGHDLVQLLHKRDLEAAVAKRVRHLEPDIAPTYDHCRAGASRHGFMDTEAVGHGVEDMDTRQVEAWDRRPDRRGAGRHDQPVIRQRLASTLLLEDDRMLSRVDFDRTSLHDELEPGRVQVFERSVGKASPIRRFAADIERQATDAEVGIAIG